MARSFAVYDEALKRGVAKEVARSVLPEGLTWTRLYMHGSLRSWIHYIDGRTGPETQLEHREIARECAVQISAVFAPIMGWVHD
jgi:thymidylate synthase (FAD)